MDMLRQMSEPSMLEAQKGWCGPGGGGGSELKGSQIGMDSEHAPRARALGARTLVTHTRGRRLGERSQRRRNSLHQGKHLDEQSRD